MEKGKKDKEFNKVDAILGNTAEETGDFIVHQKEKNITLTSSGIKKIEEFFRLKEYADVQNIHIQHAMEQALKANYLMERDKDYIVANDQIFLVDTFTGRIMEGRQYSDGLHQAIEAKENVSISLETKILATTSYQNFFNKYKKLSGMTGTAFSEKREFKHTYHLSVVVVPTNRPMIRQDHDDVVYLTKKGKLNGIMEEIKRTYEKGQPILIGTSSVSSSEEISKMLANENIPHQVLNAKQDRNEAEIIAKAGQAGTVTVATNMAGRGTDIVLDQKSLELGGLKVIGTERHEARRIDDQLRGRSGRQGDPGESIFFLSLEDKMVKLFSPERIKNILLKGGFPEDMPLKEKFLTSSIRKAQQKVEKNHYATRKNVLDYDKVNNCQRELIYAERRKLLQGQKIEDAFLLCLDKLVMTVLNKSKINPDSAISFLYESIGSECPDKYPDLSKMKKKEAMDWIHDVVYKEYKNYPCPATYREDFIRAVLLYAIDNAWMKQLQTLECLRQDIFYVGYSQTDPKSVYSIEAFQLFEKMRDSIYYMAVYMFFHTIPEIHVQSQVKE